MPQRPVVLILFTTKYRLGGSQFRAVSETLADEKRASLPQAEVILSAVESKLDVLRKIAEIDAAGKRIAEFHFVGHSGMYGPMFGTVEFPEQFSPHEWRSLSIPFADDASAYFHCCRSARWFAPFFARTFGINAYGYFWYTTISRSKTMYASAGDSVEKPLYTIGCKGRKSHGYSASLRKRLGKMPAEKLKMFAPERIGNEDTYDEVAELYDNVFRDIRVRRDEWRWLERHLPEADSIRVLDIGCGNGALLNALSGRIEKGVGVDESEAMLERARRRNADHPHLSFQAIDGPTLPFADATFDLVISMMSFRYLDWDPLLAEIKRVSRPEGKLLILDMVTVPARFGEYPGLLRDKLRHIAARKRNSEYDNDLKKLVSNPHWLKMLEYNPIRSEHEMKWYLESRFPGREVEVLNIAWNSRLVAFDTGPLVDGIEAKLTYP